MPSQQTCVGVFDSGLGGLSVLAELQRHLPQVAFRYVADSGFAPYGPRSPREVRGRCLRIAEALVERGAQMIVVACNTATATAVDTLRANLSVPVIAMEPAVKPAAAATRSGVVGVLATEGTLASARFAALLDRFAREISVTVVPCPDLVDLVEQGFLNGAKVRSRVVARVREAGNDGADTLVLGCTHFPLLRPLIADAAGPGTVLIDTAAAVARHAAATLLTGSCGVGRIELLTTGNPAILRRVAAQVLAAGSVPATASRWKSL